MVYVYACVITTELRQNHMEKNLYFLKINHPDKSNAKQII